MGQPKRVDGWNVAELAGGLLLSATGFVLQFDKAQIDDFLAALNSGTPTDIKDADGDLVTVQLSGDDVILIKKDDKIYPHGIILPVDAFSEEDEGEAAPILEGIRPAFRRVGSKIKRGFRVTSGRRKGRVVSNPATAYKPPAKASTRNKLRIAAKKKKLIRALKSKLTRRKGPSIRLRRMNHTD